MAYNPPQTPFDRLVFSITNTHGLDPQTQTAVIAWLRGAPLTDPKAIKYVQNFFPDMTNIQAPTGSSYKPGPVVGATPAQTPAPAAAVPAPTSASTPPGVGGGQATGAQAVGGMYQNYIANQRAAASRPIAENPTKGINAGGATGAEMTPPPPVTAATAPNAVNPTAPNPAPASAGGSTMANPVVPGGGGMSDITGRALVGAAAEPDLQLREAVRQAGYDPYAGGLGAQFLAKIMKPVLAAESSFYGVGQPNADYTQAGNFIGNLVKQFTTPGVNAGASVGQFAKNLLGNPNVLNQIAQTGDWNQQQQAYQNLAALANFGQSDLGQASASAQMDRLLGQYRDSALGLGGGPQFNGNFSQFLQDPRGQALARLLGIGG